MEITPPTCEDLWNDKLKSIKTTVNASWRRPLVSEVFYRQSDDIYWCAEYTRSTDGEYNELKKGTAIIYRVYPEQVTCTQYVKKDL